MSLPLRSVCHRNTYNCAIVVHLIRSQLQLPDLVLLHFCVASCARKGSTVCRKAESAKEREREQPLATNALFAYASYSATCRTRVLLSCPMPRVILSQGGACFGLLASSFRRVALPVACRLRVAAVWWQTKRCLCVIPLVVAQPSECCERMQKC